MKPAIFSTVVLSIALFSPGFAAKPKPIEVSREIEITAPFQKIVIGDYLQVVLVQDDNVHVIKINGEPKSVENVEANITHNRLTISSKRGLERRKLVIYVPVKNVSSIVLANGATLKGQGILKLENLTVTVNTDCRVALDTIGHLVIDNASDSDFVYEKNEKYRLITGAF